MARKNERFFDEEDFTAVHDQIFLALMAKWKDIVPHLYIKEHVETWKVVHGEFHGEPVLEGYPPVFPDAKCRGQLMGDHRGHPLERAVSDFDADYHYGNYYDGVDKNYVLYSCSMCDNVHEFGFKFDGTRPKKPWTSDSEEKKDNYLKQMEIFHREKQAEWEAFVAGLKTKFWSDRCGWGEFRIIFEIKPTIQSFGRVLRQLKLYKSRARDSDIVLITNDKRYDAPFKSQDITVVHPEEFGIESWEG